METTLERHLAELGWCGVPLQVVRSEVCLSYFAAGLDAAPVRRRLDGMVGDDTPNIEDCQHVLGALLDEADRAGCIRLLARPGSREPTDALEALEHLCSDGHKGQPD